MAALLASGYWVGTGTDLPRRIGDLRGTLGLVRSTVRSEGASKTAARLAAAATASPRKIIIDLKHKDYQHLRFMREKALARGSLVTEDDSFVPAEVTVDGVMHKVRMRLKGDLVDHLQGKKWSFRIETKGADAILGMRRFSIQSPERSAFLKEWFFHRFLRHEGLIALRYDYAEVIVNGDSLGIYAVEESFSKELIEHNERREGPILKLDETGLMTPGALSLGDRATDDDIYFAADVESFDTSKTLKDDTLRAELEQGRALLSGVRRGTVALGDAFDVEKAARLYAMFDILQGGHHALRWKNARYYSNPVTGKLELIAYNAYGLHRKREPVTSVFYQDWLCGDVGWEDVFAYENVFFSDPSFVETYFRELHRIAAPGYLEALFAEIDPEAREELAILNREYPLYQSPLTLYLGTRDRIWEILNPKRPVKAYLRDVDATAGVATLTIVNTSFLPLRIESLDVGGVPHAASAPLLPGKMKGAPLEHRLIAFEGIRGEETAALSERHQDGERLVVSGAELRYRLAGEEAPRSILVDAIPIDPVASLAPPPAGFTERFRRLDHEGVVKFFPYENRIVFQPGVHAITEDVVIPPGFDVRGGPGTELLLDGGAAIVSYSPLHLAGAADRPFVIGSEGGTGQGLVVIQAKGETELSHVRMEGLAPAKKGLWSLTGAATFYESDVRIADSTLMNANAEDMLNVVRAKVRLERVTMSGSLGDALDLDFCTLDARDCRFGSCGNDCIDISGTTATIANVTMDRAGDKGISVGEKSDATVTGGRIRGATIGVASKDASHARITGLVIEASGSGLAAYQKKGEFAGSTLEASGVKLPGVEHPYVKDAGSRIVVDGTEVAGEPFSGEGVAAKLP